jgi:hypothetical protein
MDGHSDIHIAAPFEITRTKSDYQKAKQVLGDDEAVTLAGGSTDYPALLHRQSQDETEEEPFIIPREAPIGSILHATY